MTTLSTPLPVEQRRIILTEAVHKEVARGGRVESQTDLSAVLRFGTPRSSVAQLLHVILVLMTFGLWLLILLPLGALEKHSRKVVALTVDEAGVVTRRKL